MFLLFCALFFLLLIIGCFAAFPNAMLLLTIMLASVSVVGMASEKKFKNGEALSKAWRISVLVSVILLLVSTPILVVRVDDYFQREQAKMDARIAADEAARAAAEAQRAAIKQAAAAERLAELPALAERYLRCLDTNPGFLTGADPASRTVNAINIPIREKLARRDYAAITKEEYETMRRVVHVLETSEKIAARRALAADYHGNDPIIRKKIREADLLSLTDEEIEMIKNWISANTPAAGTGQPP
jgi:hypothetical protein